MPETSVLAVFALASLALIVVPGPNVLYIVTRSMAQGRGAGVISAIAVQSGIFVHVLAAALGLSAILASSAVAIGTLKILGAAYLAYLGIRMLLSRDDEVEQVREPTGRGWKRIYAGGFLISTANPKVALFFLAFLPQFVEPGRGPVAAQILILGGIFLLIALVSDSAYALAAGALGGWLRGAPGVCSLATTNLRLRLPRTRCGHSVCQRGSINARRLLTASPHAPLADNLWEDCPREVTR